MMGNEPRNCSYTQVSLRGRMQVLNQTPFVSVFPFLDDLFFFLPSAPLHISGEAKDIFICCVGL